MVLGPTASGKTRLGAHVADALQGTVLSFDSRQVYRELHIGCGKDLNEYTVQGRAVPYELIDISSVNEPFYTYDFVLHFIEAFARCQAQGRLPVLCGGTGLYFDTVLKQYQHIQIPADAALQQHMQQQSNEALMQMLMVFPEALRSHADTSTRKRLMRAVEVATYLQQHTQAPIAYPQLRPLLVGLAPDVSERKRRIHARLEARLQEGLVQEVEGLLAGGVAPEVLKRLGLEFKFVTEYVLGETPYDAMVTMLETAIRQYAKRQMTWFRKMEREGHTIHWLDAKADSGAQIKAIIELFLHKND